MSAPFDPSNPFGPRRPPAPAGVSDLERLLAHDEIRMLVSRYSLAMDSRDLDALVGLFVEDYRHWNGKVGRDVLRAEFEGFFKGGDDGEVGITQIGVHVINLLDADTAHGTVYATAEFGLADRWTRQVIAYEDTYARRDGAWYFVTRNHHLFYGLNVGERPLAQPPAAWPKSPVGLGTMPYAWASWAGFYGRQ